MNKVVLYFNKCSPAPPGGYKIFYRVAGTDDPYTAAGTFYNSPAIFYDNVNPAGTCYEGYMVSDCGDDTMGNHIPFETCTSETFDNSSCGTSISTITTELSYVFLGLFDLHVDGSATVDLHYSVYDRPNRFNVYEDGVFLLTSDWKGYAPYPGPWGASLSTVELGTLTFHPVLGKTYQVGIEVGPAGPAPYNVDDNFLLSINCH
jgi:hypothetical protein